MDTLTLLQGNPDSTLTPLFLIHAVSGIALPYFALGSLTEDDDASLMNERPVYGISSPAFQSTSYQLPHSIEQVAREYVARIRREVQPEGPYLLGGWSMGGMIAVKMAELLEERGDDVLHVILIDSVNPENVPAFAEPQELQIGTTLTFRGVAKHMSLPTHAESSESGSETTSGEEEDYDGTGLEELLQKIRKHIHNGLSIIGKVRAGAFLSEMLQAPTTLIKCTSLAHLPPSVPRSRQAAIRKTHQDASSGWRMISSLRMIPLDAQHDDVFDGKHVGALTSILKAVLRGIQ